MAFSKAMTLSTLPVARRSCLASLIASTHKAAEDSLPSRDAAAASCSAFALWAIARLDTRLPGWRYNFCEFTWKAIYSPRSSRAKRVSQRRDLPRLKLNRALREPAKARAERLLAQFN